MNILGIDPSLTHTAGWHACGNVQRPFSVKSKSGQAHSVARLSEIRRSLMSEILKCSADERAGFAFVEGYGFGSQMAHTLGEVGGALKLILHEYGWTIVLVPPSTLKKFVTGKGNAPKEVMMVEVLSRWGYKATDNNDADAYALMRLGKLYMAWRDGAKTSKQLATTFAKLEVLEGMRGAA